MKFEHLEGLIAAPFCPLNNNEELNTELIPAYYAFLKQNGITGVFINGSTGEGVSLTMEEKKRIAEAWAESSNQDPDFKVMSFLGGTCLADCIELAQHSQLIGLYAVSFTAPYYFMPANVKVLAEICMKVANSVPDMPFYYYHIPVLTGVNFPMIELLRELDGKLANFAGIKYTHEDFMDYQTCLAYNNGHYDLLWGRDENMLSAMVLGAKGAVGSTFNYAAPLFYDLIAAFEANDLDKARALQLKAIDMIRLLGKYGGLAVGKAFLKLVGINCGEFRLPFKNMNAEQFEKFKLDVAQLGFDNFKSKPALSMAK